MLWKIFKVGKWVVIADLSLGVLINAAWAFGLINPLGLGAQAGRVRSGHLAVNLANAFGEPVQLIATVDRANA
jgi:hypothetical protein